MGSADLALVQRCRGRHNRLGSSYQLVFLRLVGRFPAQQPLEIFDEVLGFVAAELEIGAEEIARYAKRQPTVSSHQRQIRGHLGLKVFSLAHEKDLHSLLAEEAEHLEQGSGLIAFAEQFLRRSRILLPAASTLQRISAQARERVRQQVFDRMTKELTPQQISLLDGLTAVPAGEVVSPLQRLKEPPGFPTPRSLLRLTTKLDRIKATGVLTLDLSWLNNNFRRTLARRARRSSAHRIRILRADHRRTVLVCFLRETYVETVDHVVDMHSKIVTSTYRRAQAELDRETLQNRKKVREAMAVLRTIIELVVDESVDPTELRNHVLAKVSRDVLLKHLSDADGWLSGSRGGVFPRVVSRFSYFRQFAPSLLEHLEFRATENEEGSSPLLKAVAVLRQMNKVGSRRLPEDAPTEFLPRKLRQSFEQTTGGPDRRAYECAVLTAIRDEIRRGNVWVEQSRRFARLEDFFLAEPKWNRIRSDFFRAAELPQTGGDVDAYLRERLGRSFDRFLSGLSENSQLSWEGDRWRLTTEAAEEKSPEEEESLRRLVSWLGANLQTIRLPDLLIQIDNELDWSSYFLSARQREGRSVEGICEVVAAVMAFGCNIGPHTMAKLTNGVSYEAIRRIADWYLSEDALRGALAKIVNAIMGLNTTQVWGDGSSSSSDGQRFLFPRKVLRSTYSHRMGDYGLEFYTFVGDNYAPFYSTPIECTERDAAYVLDGLLYHESEIDPQEHYTDTHGYTELNFAAFAMLGKRFCPRIRGLHHQQIYRIARDRDYGPLGEMLGRKNGTIHMNWISQNWDRIGQFFASLSKGHATASVALKRLVACGPKNRFYRAVRELGRVFKTEFILDYLNDPALRRRIRRGLLKSEQLHALARIVHYGRRGMASQRDFDRQTSSASCLLIILAAIVYWQIREIDRLLPVAEEQDIDLTPLKHLSPIAWDNVLLYGEYLLSRGLVRTGSVA